MSYLVVMIPFLNLSQGLGAYSISKTALLGLTKVLAIECAQMGVRVNCVAPGIIKTRFSEAVSGNFNYFVIVLPMQIRLSFELFFRSWIGKFRDHHDYIFEAVGGVWDHYVSCSYLAMNNGLLMRRRCITCAQCGPCLRCIPLSD